MLKLVLRGIAVNDLGISHIGRFVVPSAWMETIPFMKTDDPTFVDFLRAGPGGVSLPVDFNGPYAASCEVTNANVGDAASLQTWNPVATPSHTDTPHNRTAQGRYRYTRFSIYLGGRALPGAGLRAGQYTGTVRVLVTWN